MQKFFYSSPELNWDPPDFSKQMCGSTVANIHEMAHALVNHIGVAGGEDDHLGLAYTKPAWYMAALAERARSE